MQYAFDCPHNNIDKNVPVVVDVVDKKKEGKKERTHKRNYKNLCTTKDLEMYILFMEEQKKKRSMRSIRYGWIERLLAKTIADKSGRWNLDMNGMAAVWDNQLHLRPTNRSNRTNNNNNKKAMK